MKTLSVSLIYIFITITAFCQTINDTIYAGIIGDGMINPGESYYFYCTPEGGYNGQVDLNNDGIDDFSVGTSCYGGIGWSGASASLSMITGLCSLEPLNYGDLFTYSMIGDDGGQLAYNYEYIDTSQSGGSWLNASNKYMPMYITNSGPPFLAWLKMTVYADAPYADVYILETCYQDFSTGTFKLSFEPGIYPIPVSDRLTISLSNNSDYSYEIKIFNSMGSFVYISKIDRNNNQIDFNDFLPGIYFIEFIPPNGQPFTRKILKSGKQNF